MNPFASAVEMLKLLREREVSARELLEFHLRRIERFNPILNAIIIQDFDHARQMADEADEARASGDDRPLLGLPLTFKDCIDVRWMRGPAGEPEHSKRRPRRDSPVAARVRAAGGVFMGKTNVPPLASDWECDNPLFGRTANPWDFSRTPGGSTGGGAAALAAGLTPLEFGSDISGSIRDPAAFCGVYGLKPSETAVPRSGHFPGDPIPNSASVLQTIGPLARSAEDLELAIQTIAGAEPLEDIAWRVSFPPPRFRRLKEFRVAVMPSVSWLPVDHEIEGALERVASHLVGVGAHIVQAQPGALDDLRGFHRLFSSLLAVMTSASRSEEERQEQINRECSNDFEEAYCRAFGASTADYLAWNLKREEVRFSFHEFFREFDILLCPADITNAFRYSEGEEPRRTITVNGKPVQYYLQLVYAGVASLPGQPSVAFPAGLTAEGIPIGLQAIGPYLEDFTPIQFAAALGREFGGFQPPPDFDETA